MVYSALFKKVQLVYNFLSNKMLNLICLAACFWALLSSRGWSIISLKAKWSIAIDQQNSCCTGSTPQSTWPAHSLKLQHGFLTNEGKIICQKHFLCLFKPYFLARNMSWKNTICPQKSFRNISNKSHAGVMDANSGCLSVVYWQREIYQRPKIWIGFKEVIFFLSWSYKKGWELKRKQMIMVIIGLEGTNWLTWFNQ